jgi:hypothetical protein
MLIGASVLQEAQKDMRSKVVFACFALVLAWLCGAQSANANSANAGLMIAAQSAPQATAPVPWASASEVNGLLSQLESTAQSTTADLGKTRIEKWKTDSGNKREAQGNSDSITRNMQTALPALINAVRSSPENLAATFKLYRNLDALHDVLATVTESTGAFGSKNDFEALSNDFNSLDRIRRDLADRLETLSTNKEAEIARLHSQVQAAQANAAPPKKVIVDDNEPEKKPAHKKKTVTKKPADATAAGTAPSPKK